MNFVLTTKKKLEQMRADMHDKTYEKAEKYYKERLENLDTALERKKKELERVKSHLDDVNTKLEVYEEERDSVRDVVKQQILNDDVDATLTARKEALDQREARLKDREARIGKEEEGEYKKGYADGSADMARKIGEITQSDRDNAMKVAMVAASSHTPVENMKELNSVHRITSGSTDQEG